MFSRSADSRVVATRSIDHFFEHDLWGRKARLERQGALVRQARAAHAERLRLAIWRGSSGRPTSEARGAETYGGLGIRSDFGRGKQRL